MASSLNERAIMDLPDEILIMILEHLNVEDLKSISLVNSRFYELVTTTPSVYKKFKLNIDLNYNKTIIEALMESNRHYENLAIPSSKHDSNKPMTCKSSQIIDLMKKVGGRVKNIEFMQFKDQKIIVCPKPIFELLATLPNIETLMFYSNNISSECVESLPTTTILKFNQLKEVHVPFPMILPILKHVNTLEKLIVFECNVYDLDYSNCMEFIEVLRNNQSTLKSFKFNAIKEFFDHDIQALCTLNLFEFEYSGSEDDDDTDIDSVNNFVKFLNNQHQMKRLTFFMDKVVFWDSIMKMKQLEFLELKISYKLYNEQILTILKNNTNTSVKFLKIILRFNHSSFKLCQTIVEYFSGVVHLDMSIIRNVEEFPEGWVLSFDDHPALKKVTLSTKASSRAELRALKIKQLEEVIINSVSPFTVNAYKIFTTNNPNIKSLTIKDARLNTERLKYIVTNLVKLEEFKFDHEDYPKLKYADLRLILENCRNIKKIDVVLNEEPGKHEIFEEFAEKLKNITLNVKFEPRPDYIFSGEGFDFTRVVSSPESS